MSRKGLPANQLAPAAARRFVRAALVGGPPPEAPAAASFAAGLTDPLIDDAVLLVSELVTNAVMYAGTEIDVSCRLERGPRRAQGAGDDGPDAACVVVEVVDRHPARAVHGGVDVRRGPPGYGLQLVGALSESWGVTYRRTEKTVWFQLMAPDDRPMPPDDRPPAHDVPPAPEDRPAPPDAPPGDHPQAPEIHQPPPPEDGPVVLEGAAGPAPVEEPDPATGLASATGPDPAPPDRPRAAAVRMAPLSPSLTRRPSPLRGHAAEWADRGGPSFLAETSELLAGQLDQDMVTALAAQLLVPRLADWCGIWLSTESRGLHLSRVWHADEQRLHALRAELEREPPSTVVRTAGTAWPWPESAGGGRAGGSALAFPLLSRDTPQGVLLLGRAGQLQMTDNVARMVEDVARRVAQAVDTARQYTRQTTISRALQRRQLPTTLASIPGVDTAVVYEPHGQGQTVGGDFYDIFPMGARRWGFLLGDVQGKDPEAMSVTGLARHLVRLLAREGQGVESVLGRLNTAMSEESAEAVEAGGEQARPRFLSMLYGELTLAPGTPGAHGTVASAGHPLPLQLRDDGTVEPVSEPQMLLGIDEGATFHPTPFRLAPGETLLCVTDGVTERRCGSWQLDDNDGLAAILAEGTGLGAKALAEHVRRAAHDFGPGPVEDDLSVLVLQAARGVQGRPKP
ncbi:SpoIIE family protein phosphatase [Streptomyces sp. NPDC048644]|uniref:SpoIIE family protein phosphatase n=1 Tax=Streptomyces sp. NPDC048644 TaxID=3365582 RepID=UPI003712FB54